MKATPKGAAVFETFATVRFQVDGFHFWPEAGGSRKYLAQKHRHLFHVKASIELFGDDREIEFHDFLDFCRANFAGGDMGKMSCEMMAKTLVIKIAAQHAGRRVLVSVFEDGEVGATVNFLPDEPRPGR